MVCGRNFTPDESGTNRSTALMASPVIGDPSGVTMNDSAVSGFSASGLTASTIRSSRRRSDGESSTAIAVPSIPFQLPVRYPVALRFSSSRFVVAMTCATTAET
jgi:hypothetical protein